MLKVKTIVVSIVTYLLTMSYATAGSKVCAIQDIEEPQWTYQRDHRSSIESWMQTNGSQAQANTFCMEAGKEGQEAQEFIAYRCIEIAPTTREFSGGGSKITYRTRLEVKKSLPLEFLIIENCKQIFKCRVQGDTIPSHLTEVENLYCKN